MACWSEEIKCLIKVLCLNLRQWWDIIFGGNNYPQTMEKNLGKGFMPRNWRDESKAKEFPNILDTLYKCSICKYFKQIDYLEIRFVKIHFQKYYLWRKTLRLF